METSIDSPLEEFFWQRSKTMSAMAGGRGGALRGFTDI